MNKTQLAFIAVFEGNLTLVGKVTATLRIKTPEELQLFTYESLLKTPQLGDWAGYIKRQMTQHGLPLRDFDESVPDAVVRIYDSVMNAPITVLQFSLADDPARRRPIELVTLFAEDFPDLKVFDFGQLLEYGQQDSVPRPFADQLIVRLQEWKLRDIPE